MSLSFDAHRSSETAGAALPGPLARRSKIRPLRDGVAAATTIFFVSALGVFVTYYFARQAQLDAVRSELAQLARVAAAAIDGDLHQMATADGKAESAEYVTALQPLVRFHRATEDVIYVYTHTLRDGVVTFGLDSAYLYKVPGDAEAYDPPGKPYDGNDPDSRRALETASVVVNDRPVHEAVRSYLSAFAPFFDSTGRLVGVVGVDMWVRHLDGRLARMRNAAAAAGLGILLLSTVAGIVVYRLRTTAEASAARDEHAVVALATARDEAEQSSRAKSAFLATMSHELRTPLNAIVGYSELIRDELADRGDSALAADVGRVVSASRHLTSIIGDILDYSKLEADRLTLVPSSLDLGAMAHEVVELMKSGAAAKGVDLSVDVRAGLPSLYGDPVRIRQVLLNLIGNAIKFTDHGRVVVRVGKSPARTGHVVCAVHDTGGGVPPEKRELLFKPFSQVDSSVTRAAGGTGLGLAISLRLVEAMGGMLRMRSRVDLGSTFRVSIPIGRA